MEKKEVNGRRENGEGRSAMQHNSAAYYIPLFLPFDSSDWNSLFQQYETHRSNKIKLIA